MSHALRAPEQGVLVERVPLWDLFIAFSKVSARGWGGGSGTIFMMHQELVHRGWMTSAQWTLDFGLARVIPGINLLGVAVMSGYRLGGFWGAIVSLLGLMLPASLITLALTVGFVRLIADPLGSAAVKGTVAVTAALTFALALENGLAVMPFRERRVTALMIAYAVACFLMVAAFHISVAILIIAGAVGGALFLRPPASGEQIERATTPDEAR